MNTFSIDKGQSDGEGGEYHIDVQSDVLDPEEDLINKQKGILLREIVDKMQPRYKQLVEMRYFKEMSYEEISVELNSPVGTVKAQLFRARDVLYNILKGTKGQI
jgi:RNA polymerase sigma-70 factor (ECF subfamily)